MESLYYSRIKQTVCRHTMVRQQTYDFITEIPTRTHRCVRGDAMECQLNDLSLRLHIFSTDQLRSERRYGVNGGKKWMVKTDYEISGDNAVACGWAVQKVTATWNESTRNYLTFHIFFGHIFATASHHLFRQTTGGFIKRLFSLCFDNKTEFHAMSVASPNWGFYNCCLPFIQFEYNKRLRWSNWYV